MITSGEKWRQFFPFFKHHFFTDTPQRHVNDGKKKYLLARGRVERWRRYTKSERRMVVPVTEECLALDTKTQPRKRHFHPISDNTSLIKTD